VLALGGDSVTSALLSEKSSLQHKTAHSMATSITQFSSMPARPVAAKVLLVLKLKFSYQGTVFDLTGTLTALIG